MIVSLIPGLPQPEIGAVETFIRLDYLFHFLEFFVLALLFFLWQRQGESDLAFLKYLLAMCIAIIFAALTEVVQIWIPGRTCNLIDVVYKAAGFFGGIIFFMFKTRPGWIRRRPAPRSHE